MGDEREISRSDATRIDLGEDLLLERTADLDSIPAPGPSAAEDFNSLEKISEQIENAKILFCEGFPEDAKKILHKVLIVDAENLDAQTLIAEIQKFELKQILGEAEDRRPFNKKNEKISEIDTESLVSKLDKDLGLNLSDSDSLFADPEQLRIFCNRLENDLVNSSASVQDWIDLGIAFLEMDLYSVSNQLLSQAGKRFDLEGEEGKLGLLSITCLLALGLMLEGKVYEVVTRVQPLLRDQEIKRENKIELFYLMGRTYELMKKPDLTLYYYQQVYQIDSRYRDIDRRLKVV